MDVSENTKSRWAAYFGGATVIASLLLVAWEIRENTVALSAQALQDLNIMANDVLLSSAENEQLASVLAKGDSDISLLSEGEYRQYWSYNYGVINTLDAAYGFYERGILSKDDYSGWRIYTCEYLAGPSVKTIWAEDKETFGTEFETFVGQECGL